MERPLKGRVAVVAGATRAAGRGIACMLGEAGAIVYCTGRSTRSARSPINRPETIEQTAELVTSHGGTGRWARVDHNDAQQVSALFERIRTEEGHIDLLVNNMSGDQFMEPSMLGGETIPFWQYPIEKGLATQQNGVHTHLTTCFYAIPLMLRKERGLIVEVTDGDLLWYNDVGVYYSLSKASVILLSFLMAQELRGHGVAVVSLTPGWMRSERMLDGFGVTEADWQSACAEHPGFERSETPFYVGRAVVALASDPGIMKRTGQALSSGRLAREYGFTDVDGSQPPAYRDHLPPGTTTLGCPVC